MVSAKLLVSSICFVSLVSLFGNISARPADSKPSESKIKELLDEGGDGGKHVHRISEGGDGGKHVHKISERGDGDDGDGGVHIHRTHTKGEPHVHHYKIKEGGDGGDRDGDGETHVHRYREEGPSETVNTETEDRVEDADAPPAAVPDSGSAQDTIEVPKIFDGLDASTIQKLKTHQFGHFGVDSTKPKDCVDGNYFNDGVVKHFFRGARDAGDALFSGVNDILQGILPEIGPVDNALDALKNGLEGLTCGAEDVFSDFADRWDSATHIAKHGLIDAFRFRNDGILAIPEGIVGIGAKAAEFAGDAVGDVVSGIGDGVGKLLDGL